MKYLGFTDNGEQYKGAVRNIRLVQLRQVWQGGPRN